MKTLFRPRGIIFSYIIAHVSFAFKAEAVPWAPGLVYGILCAIVAVLALGIPETNNYELPQTLEECEVWYKENRFKLSCVKSRRKTRRESAGAGDDH